MFSSEVRSMACNVQCQQYVKYTPLWCQRIIDIQRIDDFSSSTMLDCLAGNASIRGPLSQPPVSRRPCHFRRAVARCRVALALLALVNVRRRPEQPVPSPLKRIEVGHRAKNPALRPEAQRPVATVTVDEGLSRQTKAKRKCRAVSSSSTPGRYFSSPVVSRQQA